MKKEKGTVLSKRHMSNLGMTFGQKEFINYLENNFFFGFCRKKRDLSTKILEYSSIKAEL